MTPEEKLAREFRATLKEVCANSRDGVAVSPGLVGLCANPDEYWWNDDELFGGNRFQWDLITKPGHRECAPLQWQPRDPLTPIERLAQAAEDN